MYLTPIINVYWEIETEKSLVPEIFTICIVTMIMKPITRQEVSLSRHNAYILHILSEAIRLQLVVLISRCSISKLHYTACI